jgi:uncharacterized protein (DUF2249 family)
VHRRLEYLVSILAGGFRDIHREVGVSQVSSAVAAPVDAAMPMLAATGHAEADAAAQAGGGCEFGGGGCGSDGAAAAASLDASLTVDPRLDVREVPHAQRHATVLAALDALPADGGLVLVAPHAPHPLLAQIEKRYGGAFTTEWLLEGPQVWQLRLQRTAV